MTGFLAVEAARVSDSSGDFDDVSLTYFEFTTLAILHVMTESKLDIAILEVGLGGRLDAVNIIDADCAIITSIDLDHMEYLGDSREKIGFEKAGVMRTGAIAVVSDPVPPTSVVTYANAIGTDLWLVGEISALKVTNCNGLGQGVVNVMRVWRIQLCAVPTN